MKVKPIDRLLAEQAHVISDDNYKELRQMGLLEDQEDNWLLSNEEQYILAHYEG